jgi:hypothetical protein
MTRRINYGRRKTREKTMTLAILTEDQMRKDAPSIFTGTGHPDKTSAKYGHIPTVDVIRTLGALGWHPTKVGQRRVRDLNNVPFTKHLVELQSERFPANPTMDNSIPRILLTNVHMGTGAFNLMLGLLRLVCSNGLVAFGGIMERASVRHIGFTVDKVANAVNLIESATPKLVASVDRMQSVRLDGADALQFAAEAARLRWPDGSAPVEPVRLLQARRTEDNVPTLWHAFNRVQENVMRGGLTTYHQNPLTGRFRQNSTRAVRSIDAGLDFNQALWSLADRYAQR